MDLSLDLHREPGRPLEAQAAFVRNLDEADLVLLTASGRSVEPRLKKIRDTHHAAARSIAGGMKNSEVALVTGYTPVRVSQLLRDPAFIDLVAFYRQNLDVAFAGLYEKFSSFSHELFEELRGRFESDPESFSNSFLADLIKLTADRSGNGPHSTSVNINVSLAGRLEAARKRVPAGGLVAADRRASASGSIESHLGKVVEAEVLPPLAEPVR